MELFEDFTSFSVHVHYKPGSWRIEIRCLACGHVDRSDPLHRNYINILSSAAPLPARAPSTIAGTPPLREMLVTRSSSAPRPNSQGIDMEDPRKRRQGPRLGWSDLGSNLQRTCRLAPTRPGGRRGRGAACAAADRQGLGAEAAAPGRPLEHLG